MRRINENTKLITITMAAGLLFGAGLLQPVEASGRDASVRFVSYAPIGIAHGQKVRLCVDNTAESGGTLTLSFSYYLAHASNSMNSVPIYESELIRVPPGGFEFSEVAREDLNTEGEPETGRVQLLLKTVIEAPSGASRDDLWIFIDNVLPPNRIGRGNILSPGLLSTPSRRGQAAHGPCRGRDVRL